LYVFEADVTAFRQAAGDDPEYTVTTAQIQDQLARSDLKCRQQEFRSPIDFLAREDARVGLEPEGLAANRDLDLGRTALRFRVPLEVLFAHVDEDKRGFGLSAPLNFPVRRPGHLVEEHRRDPQIFARSDEVPLVEFILRAREDLLNVREERQSAPPKELHPLPRLLDRSPERLAGVRPAPERMERSLEVLDRAGVVPFSDRSPGVAERDVGLVGVESFALQTGVQDLRVRDAGRRLAVRIPDDVDLVAEAGGHRAPGLDAAFRDPF